MLAAFWRQRRLPPQALNHLLNIARGLDDLIYIKMLRRMSFRPEFNFDTLGWQGTEGFERRFSSLDVHQMCEQSPDPQNRITLSDAYDATGMPKGRVEFRWRDLDIFSIIRTQDIIREEFARADIGELRLHRRGGYPILAQMSAHHPSGTTRMSHSPRLGVVDADCKVHGLTNVFVASSSVFPTSGFAPPTLTILAITIRVVDRIKELLRTTSVACTVPHEQ
jgi:choline dehydrogenase-like flavoprotein